MCVEFGGLRSASRADYLDMLQANHGEAVKHAGHVCAVD